MDQNTADLKINLIDLIAIFWKQKFFIVSFSLLFSLISAVISLNLKETYLSEAILMPAELNSVMDSYSGLASTVGIDIGGPKGVNRVDEALAILKSKAFIKRFVEHRDIKVKLFSSEKWIKESNEVIYDQNIYNNKTKEWLGNFNGNNGSPSNKETYDEFINNLRIYQDLQTKFISIGIVNVSPFVAQEWLSWLISDLNHTVRQRVIDETNESITYLNEQAQKTNIKDLQNLFYMLIAEETKTVMVAKGKEDYVLKLIDPPHLPEERYFPKRSIIVLSAFFISFILSLFLVFTLHLNKTTLTAVRRFPFFALSKNS